MSSMILKKKIFSRPNINNNKSVILYIKYDFLIKCYNIDCRLFFEDGRKIYNKNNERAFFSLSYQSTMMLIL